MSKIDMDDYSSDYEDWSEDYPEQKGSRRKNGRGQNMSRSDDVDDIWDDEDSEPVKGKGRKSKDHRRDIEDRLERRRLEREIYDDYFNDMP